jgi:hypothetical protein
MNIRFQNRPAIKSMLAALVWFASSLDQSVSAQDVDKLTRASNVQFKTFTFTPAAQHQRQ